MSNIRRYKMEVAYDGKAYFGWQVQPGRRSVQGEIEQCLEQITGQHARLHCSGRTDTGVHARAQVAHVDLDLNGRKIDLQRALNGMLDDDIRIMRSSLAAPDFHARFDAVSKEYRYFIYNGPVLPPQRRHYCCHWRRPLDVDAMTAAAALLVGRHDFASFTANSHREMKSSVRLVTELSVKKKGHELLIIAKGEGFLYKMVRSLAGLLIRVGNGELSVAETSSILEAKTRTASVPTARAQGLFLWKVFYQ